VVPPEKVAEEIETDTGGKVGALKSTGRGNPALTTLADGCVGEVNGCVDEVVG